MFAPLLGLSHCRDDPAVVCSVVISGTPIQNDLSEMWALFDWAEPGLLGDSKFFKQYYERTITAGSDRDANAHLKSAGQIVAQVRDRCMS